MWLCIFFTLFPFTNCVCVCAIGQFSFNFAVKMLQSCSHWFSNAATNNQHFPIEKFVFLCASLFEQIGNERDPQSVFAVLLPNDGLHLAARLQRSSHFGTALHEHENHPHIATSCGWRYTEGRGNGQTGWWGRARHNPGFDTFVCCCSPQISRFQEPSTNKLNANAMLFAVVLMLLVCVGPQAPARLLFDIYGQYHPKAIVYTCVSQLVSWNFSSSSSSENNYFVFHPNLVLIRIFGFSFDFSFSNVLSLLFSRRI